MYPTTTARLQQPVNAQQHFGFKIRQYERITVPLQANLMFLSRGIRGAMEANVITKDISRGGASLRVGDLKSIPDDFYMQVKGTNKRMACHVVDRRDGHVHVKFHRDLTDFELKQILEDGRRTI